MIRITVYKNKDSYKGFRVSGHSGYADAGEDIVCAAVSALVITTVNSIEGLTDDRIEVTEKEEEGTIELRFPGQAGKDSDLLIRSMLMGLQEIRKDYEGFVQISYREE